MIYQVKTMDGEIFVLNTETRRWGRASSILSAPSIAATEHGLAQYVFSEEGDLVPMGMFSYTLEGRTEKTMGPGGSLCAVTIVTAGFADKIVMSIRANVRLKDDSFKCGLEEAAQKYIAYSVDNQGYPDPEQQGGPSVTPAATS